MSPNSKSELERIGILEERTKNFEKTAERIELSINGFIKESPNKFAGKWVEKVLVTFIAGIMIYLFAARDPQPETPVYKKENPIHQTQNK